MGHGYLNTVPSKFEDGQAPTGFVQKGVKSEICALAELEIKHKRFGRTILAKMLRLSETPHAGRGRSHV